MFQQLSLFRCSFCEASQALPLTSLCQPCEELLLEAPPLCPNCGGVICRQFQECQRPWAQFPQELKITSVNARYLLIGPCYSVLKSWKKRSGVYFDRSVFRMGNHLSSELSRLNIDTIVPIPQDLKRSWELGGSPAEKVALWLNEYFMCGVKQALENSSLLKTRQGELTMKERLEHALSYTVKPGFDERLNGSRVLLVDDFMTTGKTLTTAARTLREAGAKEIHLFCLGKKPLRAIKS